MKEEIEQPRQPTEEEIILIDFLEKLFLNFERVFDIDDVDISITPQYILNQLLEFYPGAPFHISHIIKFLVDNNFNYKTLPGIGTVWLIKYR